MTSKHQIQHTRPSSVFERQFCSITGSPRKRQTISMCSYFLFLQCGKFKPFRQTACLYTLRRHKDLASSVLQNHPSPITLPQVPQLAGPGSSSLLSQFWGWSLMHHRWVLAPNSFQMASQSKPPSNPLYFGYPGTVNDAEGP